MIVFVAFNDQRAAFVRASEPQPAPVSAGLGVAGVLYAFRADPALWIDRRAQVVYRRA